MSRRAPCPSPWRGRAGRTMPSPRATSPPITRPSRPPACRWSCGWRPTASPARCCRAETVEPERAVILEERRQRTDSNPRARFWEEFEAALWGAAALARPADHRLRGRDPRHHPRRPAWTSTPPLRARRMPCWWSPAMRGRPRVRALVEEFYAGVPRRARSPCATAPRRPPRPAGPASSRMTPAVREAELHPRRHGPQPDLRRPPARPGRWRCWRICSAAARAAGCTGRWSRPASPPPPAPPMTARRSGATSLPALRPAAPRRRAREASRRRSTPPSPPLLQDGPAEAELARSQPQITAGALLALDGIGAAPRMLGGGAGLGLPLDLVEFWPRHLRAVTLPQVTEAARAVLGSAARHHRLAAAGRGARACRSAGCERDRGRARRLHLPIQVVEAGGITAWLVEDHAVPVVSLAWSWTGGAALDPAGQEGAAADGRLPADRGRRAAARHRIRRRAARRGDQPEFLRRPRLFRGRLPRAGRCPARGGAAGPAGHGRAAARCRCGGAGPRPRRRQRPPRAGDAARPGRPRLLGRRLPRATRPAGPPPAPPRASPPCRPRRSAPRSAGSCGRTGCWSAPPAPSPPDALQALLAAAVRRAAGRRRRRPPRRCRISAPSASRCCRLRLAAIRRGLRPGRPGRRRPGLGGGAGGAADPGRRRLRLPPHAVGAGAARPGLWHRRRAGRDVPARRSWSARSPPRMPGWRRRWR